MIESNILLGIFVVIILAAIIYYLSQNNQQPISNEGIITNQTQVPPAGYLNTSTINRPLQPQIYDNRRADEISGDIVSDIISQYSVEDKPMNNGMGGSGSFVGSDPMSDTYGEFNNYGKKRQLNMNKMENPYDDDVYDARDYSYRLHRLRERRGDGLHINAETDPLSDSDSRNFTYKKMPYSKRTEADIKDQFNAAAVMPVEIEDDWFDVEPLLTTKKIGDTHLLHPKVHMGVNTVGSSLRNATHDIRGDIPNPKINVSPWLNSTIEPDTNIKGICTSI